MKVSTDPCDKMNNLQRIRKHQLMLLYLQQKLYDVLHSQRRRGATYYQKIPLCIGSKAPTKRQTSTLCLPSACQTQGANRTSGRNRAKVAETSSRSLQEVLLGLQQASYSPGKFAWRLSQENCSMNDGFQHHPLRLFTLKSFLLFRRYQHSTFVNVNTCYTSSTAQGGGGSFTKQETYRRGWLL